MRTLIQIRMRIIRFAIICGLLLTVFFVSAQPLENLQRHYVAEHSFVHIAKYSYAVGETMWFKLYITDPSTRKLSEISKVGYVELLNEAQQPVYQTKIHVEQGTGVGSWVIPASMQSGYYILRVYTKLQQDFPQSIATYPITIINARKPATFSNVAKKDSVMIAFFPEGGDLVQEIPSTLAFRIYLSDGTGIEADAVIKDSKNNIVANLHTNSNGLGAINFTPKTKEHYTAQIENNNGAPFIYAVPNALQQGWTLQRIFQDPLQYSFQVSKSNSIGDAAWLILHNGDSAFKVFEMESFQKTKVFHCRKDEIPKGVIYVTLLNQKGEPQAERLLFSAPKDLMTLQIQGLKKEYTQRDSVTVQINTNAIDADLSVAVYKNEVLENLAPANIVHYNYLNAFLHRTPENVASYFTEKSDTALNTEWMLLTHGWRHFKQTATTVAEYAGHRISGTVTDRKTGNTLTGVMVALTVPGSRFHYSTCISDEKGKIFFDVRKFFATEQIMLQAILDKDSLVKITIDDPFYKGKTMGLGSLTSWNISLKEALEERITTNEVALQFYDKSKDKYYLPNFYDTTAFFGKPDRSYFLDDYVRFKSMEEVLREYTVEVEVRGGPKDYRLRVFNTPLKRFFNSNPLVLIDGVPVYNMNKAISIDPLKVQRMDIVARKYFQGALSYDGIISFSTYQNDLSGYKLDAHAMIIDYAGLQLQRQFDHPMYTTLSKVKNTQPDFRNLLYWSPDIRTNESGKAKIKFSTGDLSGSYKVVVQGVSMQGNAGMSMQEFVVSQGSDL